MTRFKLIATAAALICLTADAHALGHYARYASGCVFTTAPEVTEHDHNCIPAKDRLDARRYTIDSKGIKDSNGTYIITIPNSSNFSLPGYDLTKTITGHSYGDNTPLSYDIVAGRDGIAQMTIKLTRDDPKSTLWQSNLEIIYPIAETQDQLSVGDFVTSNKKYNWQKQCRQAEGETYCLSTGNNKIYYTFGADSYKLKSVKKIVETLPIAKIIVSKY